MHEYRIRNTCLFSARNIEFLKNPDYFTWFLKSSQYNTKSSSQKSKFCYSLKYDFKNII